MESLIQLLPDYLANQIAAGEVVQRPASVVKELMENAIDAGASKIELLIKDAGKSLVQIIDNGSGMSPVDARMSFERHATSKIKEKEDLFNIRTLGFRGEALASIAAVAQVTMKTRRHEDDLGSEIKIEGSEFLSQTPCVGSTGTLISVKNLFFNVPARRNFLKSNPVETKHILSEFTHIALSHPGIAFRMEHNDTLVYDFPAENLKSRIIRIWGMDLEDKLVPVQEETPYLSIKGFVGTPETSRKGRGEQLFFVNGRFIRSSYLQHAVIGAYKDLIPAETFPLFCLFLNINPVHVDINIHPTKSEVKFDDERGVYLLLHSIVKKGLGKFQLIPDLSSDEELAGIIRAVPFPKENHEPVVGKSTTRDSWNVEKQDIGGWEKIYQNPAGFTSQPSKSPSQSITQKEVNLIPEDGFLVQLHNHLLLTQVKSGLMIIDPTLAHQRILFERFLATSTRPPVASQQILFPMTMQFSAVEMQIVESAKSELRHLGFDFLEINSGSLLLQGTPPEVLPAKAEMVFKEIVAELGLGEAERSREARFEKIAAKLAEGAAHKKGNRLDISAARALTDDLFRCNEPKFSPKGKPVFVVMPLSSFSTHLLSE